jgi:aminopeptidase N
MLAAPTEAQPEKIIAKPFHFMPAVRRATALLLIAMATGPASGTDATDTRITGYEVRLALDIPAKSLRGQTTIRLDPNVPAPVALRFPVHELSIDAVTTSVGKIVFRVERGELIVTFDGSIRDAPGRPLAVTIDYHGQPTRGLKFGADYAYTAFDTCYWMICREAPGEKATFQLELDVPSSYTVAASGERRATMPLADGVTRHHWVQDRPYSPYLYGFAAGEFADTTVKAGRVDLRLLGIGATAGELQRKFRDTAGMLAFFEERSGVPLPGRMYTQVLVPGSEAQEASTLSFIGRDQLDPILDNPHEDWVIAHELAHQWWGNLITCKSWEHFWLNEGLAVFMTAAYKEVRWGRADYERELKLARNRRDNAVQARFDVPLAYDGVYPSLSIKRAITYSKAMLFLDALRAAMGEDAFWSGLAVYTRRHAGGVVESRDFERAMTEATDRNLAPLFDEWVYPREPASSVK